MSDVTHRTIADDPRIAAAIAREVDRAPQLPADAVDLLRRLRCPATRQRLEQAS